MDHECACGCGRFISYRKRPREKLYFSGACRQRACRARNKDRHNLDRIMQAANERFYLEIYQDIHRETWGDELKEAQERLGAYEKDKKRRDDLLLGLLEDQRHQEEYIAILEKQVAEKEAEIVRLTMLLESSSKKRPR